jgi:hypothetical protein
MAAKSSSYVDIFSDSMHFRLEVDEDTCFARLKQLLFRNSNGKLENDGLYPETSKIIVYMLDLQSPDTPIIPREDDLVLFLLRQCSSVVSHNRIRIGLVSCTSHDKLFAFDSWHQQNIREGLTMLPAGNHRAELSSSALMDSLDSIPINEQLFRFVENNAIKGGALSMLNANSEKKAWGEVLLFLWPCSLWIFEQTRSGIRTCQKVYSLAENDLAVYRPKNSSSYFSVSVQASANGACFSKTQELKFKATTSQEAGNWCRQILDKDSEYLDEDNDVIFGIENMCSEMASNVFMKEVSEMYELTSFEGMLKNDYLRRVFQEWLSKQYVEEVLKFWLYAEDFRRGHPDATNPFSFQAALPAGEQQPHGHHYLSNWANAIFDQFIAENAAQQVNECSAQERLKLEAQLSSASVEDLGPNLFGSVQLACFHNLKFEWYPKFVRSQPHDYNIMLCAASCTSAIATSAQESLGSLSFSGKYPAALQQSENGARRGFLSRMFGLGKRDSKPSIQQAVEKRSSSGLIPTIEVPWRRNVCSKQEGRKISAVQRTHGAFHNWMPNKWWEYVDLSEWRDFNSNEDFEASLRFMLSKAMSQPFSDVRKRIERVEECIENMPSSIGVITYEDPSGHAGKGMGYLDKKSAVDEICVHSPLGIDDIVKLSLPGKGSGIRHHEAQWFEGDNLLTPTRIRLSETSGGELSNLDMAPSPMPIPGEWVHTAVPRKKSQAQSIFPLDFSALGIVGVVRLCCTVPVSHVRRTAVESSPSRIMGSPLRSPSLDDNILPASSNTAAGAVQNVILTDYGGLGRLYFLDPTGESIAHFISLDHVSQVGPSTDSCYHVDIGMKSDRDETKSIWTLKFDENSNSDVLEIITEWLHWLCTYCRNATQRVCIWHYSLAYEGNSRNLKVLVLHSDLQLRTYYVTGGRLRSELLIGDASPVPKKNTEVQFGRKVAVPQFMSRNRPINCTFDSPQLASDWLSLSAFTKSLVNESD